MTSARAALTLIHSGFRAAALAGGFDAWAEAGHPVEALARV